MSDIVILVELTGYTDASTSSVYRYATRPFNTTPTDTPANTFYDPRVVDPGYISRQLFRDGQSGIQAQPRAEVAYGALTLANADGLLDAVFGVSTISFKERQIRILQVTPGAAYSTAQVVLKGAISSVAMSRDLVTVYIKDRSYELNSPHTTTVYAGNNSLPNGVEGSSDIAGKAKPVMYGKVLAYEPVCVNSSRNEFQVSTRAVQSIKVYDGAVQFTAGADYTSQVDMETSAPSAGQVRVWPAGGMFRLQARQVYQLTCDVVADVAASSTAAQIIKQMALDRGISSGDISASDVSAMDALNSAVCGIVIDSTQTTLDAMDAVARSIGMSYWFDAQGVLRMARFDVPSGTAVATVAQWNDSTLELQTTGEDVPTLDLRLKYAKYWKPLATNQLAGSVSLATGNDVGQQWRVSQYTGTISPNPHKRTQIAERETLLTAKADADTEAARLYAITNVPRRTFKASNVFLDSAALQIIDLNAIVGLRWNRYGFAPDTDTLRRVTAIQYYYGAQRCDLTLWGA